MKTGEVYGKQAISASGHVTTPAGQVPDLVALQTVPRGEVEKSAGAGRVDEWVARPRPSGLRGYGRTSRLDLPNVDLIMTCSAYRAYRLGAFVDGPVRLQPDHLASTRQHQEAPGLLELLERLPGTSGASARSQPVENPQRSGEPLSRLPGLASERVEHSVLV